jgi:CubicO group peptidase (beta-lactamase class C family)
MKKFIPVSLAFLSLAISTTSFGQISQQVVDSLAPVTLKSTNTVGAYISISSKDSLLVSGSYGFNDKIKRTVLTDSTVFPISSNTKAFNSLLIFQEYQKENLDIFAPLRTYLPDLKFQDQYLTDNVTLTDLFTHRVGLPRYDFTYYMLSEAEKEDPNEAVFHKLKFLELAAPFRTAFMYGNNQYILAAYTHERLTGKKWERSLEQEILEPLEMESSYCDLDRYLSDTHRSVGYQDNTPVEIQHAAPLYEVSGMGNMFSTVKDLQKWTNFLIKGNDSVLDPDYLDYYLSGQLATGFEEPYPGFSSLQYGFGWFVFDYYGHKVVMHHGDNVGHQSLLFLLPDDDISGVLVANNGFSSKSFNFNMFFSILQMVAEKELSDWNEIRPAGKFSPKYPDSEMADAQPGPEELQAYEGTYRHQGFGEIQCFTRENELWVKAGSFEGKLESYGENTFRCTSKVFKEDYLFRFISKGDGIIGLETDLLEPSMDFISFEKQTSPGA